MIFAIACAVIGACLFWLERNDTTETVGNIKLTSGFWTGCILVVGAILIREHHTHVIHFAAALGLFVFLVTAPHNLLLKPPAIQKITPPRDVIQRGLFYLFAKSVGDLVGLPLYITFLIIRCGLPVLGMGLVLDSNALLIAAPLAALSYYAWVDGDRYKIARAAMLGGVVLGALAVR